MNHQTEQIIIRNTELGEERWLIIPEGTTKIDEHAYESREDFTHVSIPASVTEIGERAFAGCSKLVEVTLHRELTSLGKFVFSRCTALRMVTLPYTYTMVAHSIGADDGILCLANDTGRSNNPHIERCRGASRSANRALLSAPRSVRIALRCDSTADRCRCASTVCRT